MKIKHKDVLIPEDGTDPFYNCKLDRRRYANILTDIVSTYADGFVLAVNNEWGAGKTTFVKMWRQQLINDNFKTLYYNAWENDFEKDVLVALISELKELEDEAKEKFKKVIEKAAPLTTKLLPALAKGIASKYVGDEFVKELINGFADVTAEGLKDEIQAYANRKKSLKDFKLSLEKFVEEASPDKPVVFFIDELDRCRPNYAVEVLETVKHLFNVSGIVFVLSIDKEQLGHAVKGVYGSENLNVNEYLRRFIDLEYSIPDPNFQNFIEYLYKYYEFNEFFEDSGRQTSSEFKNDGSTFKNIAFLLLGKGNFELRQIEKIFGKIRLVLKGFDKNQYTFPELILIIAYISEKKKTLLKSINRNRLSLQEMATALDDLLLPIKDHPNRHQILNLYASFLYRYYVDYHDTVMRQNIRLVDENEHLLVNSKFNSDDNFLGRAVIHQMNKHHVTEVGLSWIFQRYNLTSNFQS